MIEIQTENFSAIKRKLTALLKEHHVRLVYPLPTMKWIVLTNAAGNRIRRRKSTKKRKLTDIYDELVRIPSLINEEKFTLEVLLVEEEEIRCDDGKGSWRRKGISIRDRKLLNVLGSMLFENSKDFLDLLPPNLLQPFSSRSLAKQARVSIRQARRMAYCFKKMGMIEEVEKRGRQPLYQISFQG